MKEQKHNQSINCIQVYIWKLWARFVYIAVKTAELCQAENILAFWYIIMRRSNITVHVERMKDYYPYVMVTRHV